MATTKFDELRKGMAPERLARIEEQVSAHLLGMQLAELRAGLGLTQEGLASRLDVTQSSVSRLESRRDMLVSTLSQTIAALGGELRISAVFPDGAVEILTNGVEAERP